MMAKLYFRYGAMGAAKSMNLLAVAHNYRSRGRRPLLIKPKIDTRDLHISSRAGISQPADVIIGPDDDLLDLVDAAIAMNGSAPDSKNPCDCILVDEAQFLTPEQVNDLRAITLRRGPWGEAVPVICYGLRADYKLRLFPGSRRLFELADSIEEIKTICAHCPRKATQNLRLSDDEGQVVVGGDDLYESVCMQCYAEVAVLRNRNTP